MKIKRKISRILLLPLGLIKQCISLANIGARDLQNAKQFPLAIIDDGNCFNDHVKIGKQTHICSGSIINNTIIGNYTYVSRNSLLQNCEIGNFCSLAHDVNIGLGKHPLSLFSTSPLFYRKVNALKFQFVETDFDFKEYEKITIGHDVWIGSRATILDGVTVGNGAVIASNAVVTKDVPDYAIVAGIPAKVIRYRFEKEEISRLLNSKWWSKDLNELHDFIK